MLGINVFMVHVRKEGYIDLAHGNFLYGPNIDGSINEGAPAIVINANGAHFDLIGVQEDGNLRTLFNVTHPFIQALIEYKNRKSEDKKLVSKLNPYKAPKLPSFEGKAEPFIQQWMKNAGLSRAEAVQMLVNQGDIAAADAPKYLTPSIPSLPGISSPWGSGGSGISSYPPPTVYSSTGIPLVLPAGAVPASSLLGQPTSILPGVSAPTAPVGRGAPSSLPGIPRMPPPSK
jgi:hypothetical protein